ncbi:MAG: sulfurtransferase [Rubrivivax sp.]|nr:sulfurtransferase [Rubrivivax sp.]
MFRTLISATDLLALTSRSADSNNLVLLDCSFDLVDPAAGERAYAEAHLPGAFHAHLERDLCGAKTGKNGRHPLPARAAFAERVGAWGIGPATQVVAYDAQGGPAAARAWWMLRWLGHEAVAVLDGGIAAWRAAGGKLESARPEVKAPAPYPMSAEGAAGASMPVIDAEGLAARLSPGAACLVDARAPERFRGDVEPLDPVAGHIPGAINRFFKDNLGADGRFKPAATLRAEFAALGIDDMGQDPALPVVHYCGSGVTAAHNLLAMVHAGWPDTVLYPGSWSEWCAEPTRPTARG